MGGLRLTRQGRRNNRARSREPPLISRTRENMPAPSGRGARATIGGRESTLPFSRMAQRTDDAYYFLHKLIQVDRI